MHHFPGRIAAHAGSGQGAGEGGGSSSSSSSDSDNGGGDDDDDTGGADSSPYASLPEMFDGYGPTFTHGMAPYWPRGLADVDARGATTPDIPPGEGSMMTRATGDLARRTAAPALPRRRRRHQLC